jgi:hypothetical protein
MDFLDHCAKFRFFVISSLKAVNNGEVTPLPPCVLACLILNKKNTVARENVKWKDEGKIEVKKEK